MYKWEVCKDNKKWEDIYHWIFSVEEWIDILEFRKSGKAFYKNLKVGAWESYYSSHLEMLEE
jgi:hypothetical protein